MTIMVLNLYGYQIKYHKKYLFKYKSENSLDGHIPNIPIQILIYNILSIGTICLRVWTCGVCIMLYKA